MLDTARCLGHLLHGLKCSPMFCDYCNLLVGSCSYDIQNFTIICIRMDILDICGYVLDDVIFDTEYDSYI